MDRKRTPLTENSIIEGVSMGGGGGVKIQGFGKVDRKRTPLTENSIIEGISMGGGGVKSRGLDIHPQTWNTIAGGLGEWWEKYHVLMKLHSSLTCLQSN